MELRSHSGVDAFLDVVGDFLLRDEARHNLMFGICTTLRTAPDAYPEALLWSVEEDGDVVAAALMTPPFNLVVAQPRDEGALRFLAASLSARLPGVTGALPEAETFAQAWGVPHRLRMASGRVCRPSGAAVGRCGGDAPRGPRGPRARDRVDPCVRGRVDSGRRASPRPRTGRRPEPESGGTRVSRSGRTGARSSRCRGSAAGRRTGRASARCTRRRRCGAGGTRAHSSAQLSAELLAGGLDYCFLYTDLANPTSNKIYMNVGYELVCESADYAFEN